MAALPVPLNVHAQQQATLARPVDSAPAPLPVPNPTKSFWIDTPGANPLAKEGSQGPLTADADIAIIGSGISGVSAAYHFSRLLAESGDTSKPLKIIILEARDFCSGATGRNGGHLTAAAFEEFTAYSTSFGTDEAIRAIALEKRTVSEIVNLVKQTGNETALDLVSGGRVNLLFTEPEVVQAKLDFEAAKAAGIDVSHVDFLTKEQVEKEYGASYPAFRTPGYNIWPLKLVTHLYNLGKTTGENSSTSSLHLHTNTPVTAIAAISDATSARRWNLITPRGPIAASYVLHATNAYASHLLPHLRGPSGIVPVRGQIIATRAAVSEQILTRMRSPETKASSTGSPRPLEPGQTNPLVILGGGREATKPTFELYVTDDSTVNSAVGDALRKFLPVVFPGKYEDNKEPEMEWSGIMGFTKTGDPFVGPIIDRANPESTAYAGQYISAGFTGHGMPRTFSCAEAVAQMMVADIQGKEWSIPEWLPRHHLTENRLGE